MIEADKLKEVKSATVAIGLSNKDTNDVISSFGTGFFIGGEYIVSSAHVFSQCLNYNTIYKETIGNKTYLRRNRRKTNIWLEQYQNKQ